jgi:hypothetical protein
MTFKENLFLFFFLQLGGLPTLDFVFDTQSIFLASFRSCEGCRIRSRDCCVGSMDLLAGAISTEPPQPHKKYFTRP